MENDAAFLQEPRADGGRLQDLSFGAAAAFFLMVILSRNDAVEMRDCGTATGPSTSMFGCFFIPEG